MQPVAFIGDTPVAWIDEQDDVVQLDAFARKRITQLCASIERQHTMHLQKGDLVRIRRESSDDWCPATVLMVSGNGISVALMVDGIVREGGGFHVGFLPLTYNPDTNHFLGLKGDIYQLEKSKTATH